MGENNARGVIRLVTI